MQVMMIIETSISEHLDEMKVSKYFPNTLHILIREISDCIAENV